MRVLPWTGDRAENIKVNPVSMAVDMWDGPPLRINCSFLVRSRYQRNLWVKWWKQNRELTWDRIEDGTSWWGKEGKGCGWSSVTNPRIGNAWWRHDRMMLSLQRHGRRSRREVNDTIERNTEQENLVVGLIRDFGIMQNVTKITACLPLPQAAGEPIPRGIILVTKMPETCKNVSWSCQSVPKPVDVWRDLCMTTQAMTREECEKKSNHYGWIQNTRRCLIATPIDEPCNTVRRIRTKSQQNEMSCQNVTQNFDNWNSWKTLWGPSVLEHYNYLGEVQWCIQWSGVKNQSHYRALITSTTSQEFRPQKED
ncbi:uncharacterized protein LOC134432209 [Melospiza melodia melodia]|uniref:uncharacterized protein LOC134432209 n=1 Tax=Melospiza melodia melodia TaxID=1914991 RepID=UPI002FD52929